MRTQPSGFETTVNLPDATKTDRTPILVAGICLAAMLLSALWTMTNAVPPSWDQAHYLDLALHFIRAGQAGGFHAFAHAVASADPGRAPLFQLAMIPMFLLLGDSQVAGAMVNVLVWPMVILCTAGIAGQLFGRRAVLPAAFIAATTPLLVGLGRDVLQDFLLVGLTCLALWLILFSDGLVRRGPALALGLTVGLGLLTKVTFPIPLFLPGIVWVARAALEQRQRHRPIYGLLTNIVMTLAVATLIAAPWYIRNGAATLAYIQSTTSGSLAIGAGPEHPLTIQAIGAFTLGLINNDLSWPCLVLAALATTAAGVGGVRWLKLSSQTRWSLAFCLSWGLTSYLSVALQTNQDVRLMAAGFPAFAVLAGAAFAKASHKHLSRIVLGGFLLIGAWQTYVLEGSLPVPQILTHPFTFPTPFGAGSVRLGGQVLGYEVRPGSHDDDAALMRYLIAEARSSRAAATPVRVAILQEDPEVNGNTLGFLSDVAHAHLVFVDLDGPGWRPKGQSVLQTLLQYQLLLYIRQPKNSGERVGDLNRQSASAQMTPKIFARMSDGGRTSFSLHGGQEELWVLKPRGGA